MTRGRKTGYIHPIETKRKISKTLTGRTKTAEHRTRISRKIYDLDNKCALRLKELREDYPEQGSFFDENEPELLFAMRDLKSERELDDIKRYKETWSLSQLKESQLSFEYSSSSYHAVEDSVIELLDLKRFLKRHI